MLKKMIKIAGLLALSSTAARAQVVPNQGSQAIQDIRIVGVSTNAFNCSTCPYQGSQSVLDTRVFGLILSTSVAYTNQPNTFTSSNTFNAPVLINNSSLTLTGAGGVIVSASSITAGAFFGSGSHLTGISSTSLPSDVAYTDHSNTFTSSQTFNGNIRTKNNILDDGLGNMTLGKNTVPFDTTHFSSITVYNDGYVIGIIQPNQANPGVQITGFTKSNNQSCYIGIAGGSYANGGCRQGYNGGNYSGIYYDNGGNSNLSGGNAGSPVNGGPYVQLAVNGSGGVNGTGNISGLDLNGQGFQTDGNGNFQESQSLYVNTGNNSLAPAFQVNDTNGNPALEVYNGDGFVGDYVKTAHNTLDDGLGDATFEGNLAAGFYYGDGSNISNISGSNINAGTVGASYLPATVAYTNATNSFSVAQTFNANISAGVYYSTQTAGSAGAVTVATCTVSGFQADGGGCSCSGGISVTGETSSFYPTQAAGSATISKAWQCQEAGATGGACATWVKCSRITH
jgi:hypothetical protein